jgi:aryl-alcohol dehydrogenase-like predicted oxidoreductase
MRYTALGQTGLPVSRIAFGTWQLGGASGPTDESAAIAAIRRAAAQGGALFDTAQAHGFGASEELLAGATDGLDRSRGSTRSSGSPSSSGPGWAART